VCVVAGIGPVSGVVTTCGLSPQCRIRTVVWVLMQVLLHLRTLHVLLRQHGAPAAAAAAAALLTACGASQAECSACGRACLTTSKVTDGNMLAEPLYRWHLPCTCKTLKILHADLGAGGWQWHLHLRESCGAVPTRLVSQPSERWNSTSPDPAG